MADVALLTLVADRLEAEPPADGAGDLVLAAFQGTSAVGATLRGDSTAATRVAGEARERTAPAVYLSSLEVEGFRGIGDCATLTIDPGPGLTLIVGRNGSGKSSFSEALEMLLTGSNQRWKGRQQVWRDGWQNLHHRTTCICAQFTVDGRRQPLTLQRGWADGGGVDASTLTVDGKPAASLDALGWTQPLADYPPLLSHNELEKSLDEKQTTLYDALAGILGLGDIAAAQHALREARLQLENTAKNAKAACDTLMRLLEQTDDERALLVLAALRRKPWDLDTVRRTVGDAAQVDEHSTLSRLRDLAGIQVLDREQLNAAIDDLRIAATEVQKVRGTNAALADDTAQVLQQALLVHSHSEGSTCPVCGTDGVLTYEWRLRTGERITELRARASEVAKARRIATEAVLHARRLITAMPVAVLQGKVAGVDTDTLVALWDRWVDVPDADDLSQLRTHLETVGPPLIAWVARVRAAAREQFERRQTSWRPAADAINGWLPLGARVLESDAALKRVAAAEKWLRNAHDALRDERFRPIAGAVQENWTELRQDSNVSLGELELTGSGNTRRLRLDVHVDGEPGSALGVMSQGELNCLALSLFLPRASLPESPFHFVVIDDPVQAMDPAKVEGLARALDRAARERQVIVLTHDTRLADAIDYLGIRAARIEVVRREGSVVELRRVHDAVRRYIGDAMAVAESRGLPDEAKRVIPGFCRLALEAACGLAVTRRMLRQGRRYADVQDKLAQPRKLYMWLALAFFDDAERGGDVNDYLQRHHPLAVDLVKDCNRGTHGAKLMRDPRGFVRGIESLTTAIAPPLSSDG